MDKSFYHFANFFIILSVAASVFQSTIRIMLGPGIFSLESFPIWFLVTSAVTLAGSYYMLKYYYLRQYRATFYTGTIAILTGLIHAGIVYIMLTSGGLVSYVMPTLLISVGANLVYAISLMFSRARKKIWLKTAGISIFITGLAAGALFIWGMNVQEVQLDGTLEKIIQRLSLLGSLIPLLYILNFMLELKELKENSVHTGTHKSEAAPMSIVVIMALCTTLVFGVLVATEAGSALYWQKQNAKKTEALVQLSDTRTFVGSRGDTLQYLLLKPLDYEAGKPSNDSSTYPLVVNLPYGGYEGAEIAQILSVSHYRKHYPAFLFIPYCPPGSGWGGIPAYPDIDTLVFEAIVALDQEFPIDTNRRYITGISRGGYGSWHFITTRPQMFAAAIPVCGVGDPRFAPDVANVAVWAFHGEEDRNVPVSGSREMVAAMKKAGGDPRYTEFKNEGHNIWHLVRDSPGLLDWLFAQKRE
ncbi:prolyl oligopeptidase family serine peptidase [Cesiribacter sp. SM1]|uniref:carboxylesterase family protein n=1 Tax=Cesiribacter sp. SM1 TaxID=2861196 RepID=UPI001CD5D09D|nr:prolyl oligopeptidase family serine peptidase [Cesiribacter sp. SM1]